MVASESQRVQSGGIQNQNVIILLFQVIVIIILQLFFSCTRQGVRGNIHILQGFQEQRAYLAGVTVTLKYCLFVTLHWLFLYVALSVIRTFLEMSTATIHYRSSSVKSGVFGSSAMAWQWENSEEISDSLHAYTGEQGFQTPFSYYFPQLWKINSFYIHVAVQWLHLYFYCHDYYFKSER